MTTNVDKHVAIGLRALADLAMRHAAAAHRVRQQSDDVIAEMIEELGGAQGCFYATDVARRARNTMESQRTEIQRLRAEIERQRADVDRVTALLTAQTTNELAVLRMAVARGTKDRRSVDPYVDTERALAKIIEERDRSLLGLRCIADNLGVYDVWNKDPITLTGDVRDKVIALRAMTSPAHRCERPMCGGWTRRIVAWTGTARMECSLCGWKKYISGSEAST